MAEIGDAVRLKPGQRASVSGFYDCDTGCGHHWSTDVKGHPMPPLPPVGKGSAWRLAEQRPNS